MTEQKTYTLSEAERRHVAEVKAQMSEFEAEVLKLKGAIYEKQSELSFMKRHLTIFVGNIATNAGLPPTWMLAADGASIIVRD